MAAMPRVLTGEVEIQVEIFNPWRYAGARNRLQYSSPI